MSNGVFNFKFLARLLSKILGGPKFTLGGPTPPGRPLAEKFFVPKASISQYVIMSNGIFNFKFLALLLSEILRVPNLH